MDPEICPKKLENLSVKLPEKLPSTTLGYSIVPVIIADLKDF